MFLTKWLSFPQKCFVEGCVCLLTKACKQLVLILMVFMALLSIVIIPAPNCLVVTFDYMKLLSRTFCTYAIGVDPIQLMIYYNVSRCGSSLSTTPHIWALCHGITYIWKYSDTILIISKATHKTVGRVKRYNICKCIISLLSPTKPNICLEHQHEVIHVKNH